MSASARPVELSNGAVLSVTDVGSGTPVVLLHGVCMAAAFFARNVEPLAEHHRVIAVDYRGHGQSPPARDGHTVPQYARDVRELLATLGLRDVVLVGWSMGSLVAWDYLEQFADDPAVKGVAIVSQGPSDLTQPGWEHGIADTTALREWLEALQADTPGFLAEFVPELVKEPLSDADFATLHSAIAGIEPGAATSILADQTLADYRPVLAGLAVPHLLVWGEDEKVGKLAAARWLADELPAAELHVFEESGHCPMWEEPERFNALLSDWIARLG